ncbi:hypothetical protein ABK040_016339 [Willaertia magna]
MNINDENSLKQLIELLSDYNLTKEAINSEMLIHRIYRVLKEQINKSEKHIHTYIIFIYLLENRTLHITSIIEHVLLCVDENVVLVLGKYIFTLMIRSIDFTVNVILNNVNILNEIIQWSIGGQQHTTRI